MALPSTIRRFDIELSDADRGVYDTLELRVAQHPSETERFLVARLMARCLEHREALEFSRGLCVDEEPALWERDLRGDLVSWIEVGSPGIDRLHRATKTGARVAIYGWRQTSELARDIAARPVHRAAEIELYVLDGAFLDAAAGRLERVNRWSLARSGGALYLTIGQTLLEGTVEQVPIPV